MPGVSASAHSGAEGAALMSRRSPSCMEAVELRNVSLQLGALGATRDAEVRVRTAHGDLLVAAHGDRGKPAILTYHDLGLDCSSMQQFFEFVDMRALLQHFCVLHVNAPGQEQRAPSLPDHQEYPSMDELAAQLSCVLAHFGVKSFVGFGVGLGANILARFALTNPEKVDALMLVNCSAQAPGWLEWGCHVHAARLMRSRGMVPRVVDDLLTYHLGRGFERRNGSAAAAYRAQLRRCNAGNLARLLLAYARRRSLPLARAALPPVLNLAGAHSPALPDTVALNARLDPATAAWMKLDESAMPLEEQPRKVAEAFRLLLQGLGYVAPLSPAKIVLFRRLSDASRRRACRLSPVIRITENPICEAVAC